MKRYANFLVIIVGEIILNNAIAGNCDHIVLNDDFSSSGKWNNQGSGAVNVTNGKCNFDNVFCGYYNRIYRSLGKSLSDNYWKAECDINILNANPYGYGTGEVVMALTAGTLDFMSYGVDSNYTETSQDGIAVILVSSSSSDENMNDWFFCIEGKKDNNRTYDLSSLIYANSSISHYYIRLERSSKLFATLSVFSDSTFTNHLPGSPIIFKINSAITNLNTLQHGTITPGFYPRFINATIDNDLICDDLAVSDTVIPELPVNRRTICSENQIGNKILLYPNPSSTFIIINNQDSALINENDYYRIYNLLGNLMTSNKLISNKLIDISTLPEGVFLFIVSDSKKTCWAKFKKHY